MRKVTLDLEALRSFVLGVELGNFAEAAERLNRSTSAVSAHLKKLEMQLEQPILKRSGRSLVLLPAGEELLSYAKRLLAVNDDAVMALRRPKVSGIVRIGLQEDFGERFLTDMLAQFNRTNPEVVLDVQVSRNRNLMERFQQGKLDLVLCWNNTESVVTNTEVIGQFPMQWIGVPETFIDQQLPLSLILFESPCLLREVALKALDESEIPWRVAMSSHSLSGVWSATEAGLGITVRTPAGCPDSLAVLEKEWLPKLPNLALCLIQVDGLNAAAQNLKETVLDELKQNFPDWVY
ncbi:LysR family transcriptional regulator [Marinomonas rhizomae]|uniref:DNA-binding transcriptional LysR family regulator n=1 Tax=Marinomonas rhizomae TaxID=491948 RepID=A0A366JF85_9GAMM|nr:LysR substrate-binding domain-containing protein [Marinomonas rhizomae]RBP85130.1 DNA-binding transcriptional LysR family regulator [Marinomonas rhizomae]RNF76237.1 LysR family transcriptional regulator [Marinomonas rhizomae]